MCVFKVPLLSWYCVVLIDVLIRSGKLSGGVEASSLGG
jgi:hypothetical protein